MKPRKIHSVAPKATMFAPLFDAQRIVVERGLDRQRRYLVVTDGSKALRAGVERVFGEQVEVQRCQIHKRRNVKENCQRDCDRRMRNAYAQIARIGAENQHNSKPSHSIRNGSPPIGNYGAGD